jgi:uncharacterized membrane protein YvbJ
MSIGEINCRFCGELNSNLAISCKKCKHEIDNTNADSTTSVNIDSQLSSRIDKFGSLNWGLIAVILAIISLGLRYIVPLFQNNNSKDRGSNYQKNTNDHSEQTINRNEGNVQMTPPNNSEIKVVKSNKVVQFPDFINDFKDKTEIQQKTFSADHIGAMVSGSGKISQIEKCGFPRKSIKYRGENCIEVTLKNSGSIVAIYNSKDATNNLLNFNKDQLVEFNNCNITEIISWSFWTTVYCDQ